MTTTNGLSAITESVRCLACGILSDAAEYCSDCMALTASSSAQCERCGSCSDDRAHATPDDLNSPLWCGLCRADAANDACDECDGVPLCAACAARYRAEA